MKQYNRSLDYTVLALAELKKGNGVLAARLLAKAVEQKDVNAAIAILEASNKQAFQVQANSKARLKASEEFPFEGAGEECAAEEEDFMSGDPLDDIAAELDEEAPAELEEMEEEAPGAAMAKVLSKMVRKTK